MRLAAGRRPACIWLFHIACRVNLTLAVARALTLIENLSKAGWSLGWISAVDSRGRTIWIADTHRGGQRFIVRANERLTAFVELESAIRPSRHENKTSSSLNRFLIK